MTGTKADTIARLQKEITALQGFGKTPSNDLVDAALGPIATAFPNASFPLGTMHEFIAAGPEATASTGGFIAGLLGSLMKNNGVCLWISASRNIFPPALRSFGIAPDKIIFIDLRKEKEILWTMEEALKCHGLAAIIGEIQELNFTASRRLQLAVEQSKVTGFILRRNPKNLNITACVTRWKVRSLASALPAGMPGVGFPRWHVELLKVRNGKPGAWQIEFVAGRFRPVDRQDGFVLQQKRKAG